jgi:hypothetical protein
MPRLPRLHVPGGCYHVILRNHREDLFGTEADRRKLNDIVAESLLKHQARLHAMRRDKMKTCEHRHHWYSRFSTGTVTSSMECPFVMSVTDCAQGL